MTRVVLDDRLLIEELLVGLPGRGTESLHTTTYWYYRACRAAVEGAGGHLSAPFTRLETEEQEEAVLGLLELRPDIELPDPLGTAPQMARLARRHPRLNLMNLEAVAVGQLLSATMWLSVPAAAGVLPRVLDVEQVSWRTVPIESN